MVEGVLEKGNGFGHTNIMGKAFQAEETARIKA